MANGSLEVQMKNILQEFNQEVQNATNNAINSTSKESVQKLKNTSPKGSPHRRRYAEGWSVKRTQEGSSRGIQTAIVHNRTNYQLTHLLENGHVIRNGKGEYGRTHPIKHIEPVEEWANDELVNEIERKLNR